MPDEHITTNRDIQLAEIKFMHDHLTSRARICYTMVAASVTCLCAGIVMLIVGVTGNQSIWFESDKIKITAGGFGAVTLLASVAWGFIAFLSRPEIRFEGRNHALTLGPRYESRAQRIVKKFRPR
jgi:membrane protein YdbS with pleckstrin-like domain